MSVTIKDINGNNVTVFLSFKEDCIDAVVRADTKEVWELAAISQALLLETDEGVVPAPGVNIDAIGPITIVAGVYDEEGEQVVAPIMDTRYHLNMRLEGPILLKLNSQGFPKWKVTALHWTAYGVEASSNKEEVGKDVMGVTLIDPDSIQSPCRVWA